MKTRAAFAIAAAAYWGLCLLILVLTRPWNGGDGSIGFGVLINLPTFPAGVVPTAVLAWLTGAAVGTRYENALSLSPLWWLFLFVGCSGLGFVQWFLLLPKVLQRIRLLTSSSTGP